MDLLAVLNDFVYHYQVPVIVMFEVTPVQVYGRSRQLEWLCVQQPISLFLLLSCLCLMALLFVSLLRCPVFHKQPDKYNHF